MNYLLKGWVRVDFEGMGEIRLEAGDAWYQPPGVKHEVLDYSGDFEFIEITMPADDERQIRALALHGKIDGSDGAPEGWTLAHDDCLLAIDLDRDQEDELLIAGEDGLGVIDWADGRPRVVWKEAERVGRGDLAFGCRLRRALSLARRHHAPRTSRATPTPRVRVVVGAR